MYNQINRIKDKLQKKNIKLSNVVDKKKIREFEMRNNIKLPNEIVEFYTLISNGCEMIDGFYLYSFEEWKYNADRISNSFPYEKYFVWEDENDIEETMYNLLDNGNIELIDIGDSQTWNIIVSGNQYGKMWFFSDVGIQPAAPEKHFLDWFEYWLDGNEDYFKDFIC